MYKHGAIGVVMEIFGDLNPQDPWVRVIFTTPAQTYQWCKQSGLELIKEGGHKDPPLGAVNSGSL